MYGKIVPAIAAAMLLAGTVGASAASSEDLGGHQTTDAFPAYGYGGSAMMYGVVPGYYAYAPGYYAYAPG